MLSLVAEKKVSFMTNPFGNLQKYISRIQTGQHSPASGHENNHPTLILIVCNVQLLESSIAIIRHILTVNVSVRVRTYASEL